MTYFKTTITLLSASIICLTLPETVHAGEFYDGIFFAVTWGRTAAGLSPLSLSTIITNITSYLFLIIGLISTLAVVIGGFMYVASLGDEQKVAKAKKIVFSALGGLLIVLLANALTSAVIGIYSGTINASPLTATIINAITLFLSFTAVVAVAAFVYGGFTYIASGGSEEKAQRGKKIIIYAIIGIVIIMLSASIVNIVINPSP